MYLRGSNWSMRRKRRRSNPFLITVLVVLIGVFVYIDRVVLPTTPPLFMPTPTPTRSPESFLVDAENFYSEGKIVQAMASYEEAVLADPKNPSTYLALARLQVFAGDTDAALENAENALLLNPNNAVAHAIRGWALGLSDPPNFTEAQAALSTAIELDPNNALPHAYLAEILGIQHELGSGGIDTLDRAISESRIARDLGPDLLEVHRARGYIHMLVQEYPAAVNEFEAAIAINDNIADLHMSLGRAYDALEQADQAVSEYTRAYSLDPTNPWPNYRISRTLNKAGEYAQAVQYAEQAVKDAPTNPVMLANLGSMHYKIEEYNQAIQYLGLAIRGGTTEDGQAIEPMSLEKDLLTLEFFNRYGLALARLGQCNDAVQMANLLLQGVPDEENTVYNANEMIRICVEGDITPTPEPEAEATPAP